MGCGARREEVVFSIGEFSKITGLTVKTLRFYHEQGLLVPSCVDEETGYRLAGIAGTHSRNFVEKAKVVKLRVLAEAESIKLSSWPLLMLADVRATGSHATDDEVRR
ncbi:MAG: MerR family DNA-binding transcriptional regulator [Pirellulales bacterium]